jgi:hypothetical protein
MGSRKPRYMRIIYFDRDARTANVSSEIITNDTEVNHRTSELQRGGRSVYVQTTEPVRDVNDVPPVNRVLAQLPAGFSHDPGLSW